MSICFCISVSLSSSAALSFLNRSLVAWYETIFSLWLLFFLLVSSLSLLSLLISRSFSSLAVACYSSFSAISPSLTSMSCILWSQSLFRDSSWSFESYRLCISSMTSFWSASALLARVSFCYLIYWLLSFWSWTNFSSCWVDVYNFSLFDVSDVSSLYTPHKHCILLTISCSNFKRYVVASLFEVSTIDVYWSSLDYSSSCVSKRNSVTVSKLLRSFSIFWISSWASCISSSMLVSSPRLCTISARCSMKLWPSTRCLVSSRIYLM